MNPVIDNSDLFGVKRTHGLQKVLPGDHCGRVLLTGAVNNK